MTSCVGGRKTKKFKLNQNLCEKISDCVSQFAALITGLGNIQPPTTFVVCRDSLDFLRKLIIKKRSLCLFREFQHKASTKISAYCGPFTVLRCAGLAFNNFRIPGFKSP